MDEAVLFHNFSAQLRELIAAEERARLRPIIEAELRREAEEELKRLGSQTLRHNEVARYLGDMSKSKLDDIRRNPRSGFPKPLDVFGNPLKPMWLRSELDAWLDSRPRLPY